MIFSSSISTLRKYDHTTRGVSKNKGFEGSRSKKFTNAYNRPTHGKCFRCEQQSHLSNECSQRKTLAINKGENTFGDQDSEDSKDDTQNCCS